MAPRKLLMLCYYYPPQYNSGVERSLKFAKYLPEFGWIPVVVTTNTCGMSEGAGTEERIVRTTELLNVYRWLFNKEFREARRTKCEVPVMPATTPDKGLGKAIVGSVLKWAVIPDVHIGWVACAFWPALKLLRGGAEAIYTTSPTESSHLFGLVLKRLTGKPWVMDLRDPWTFEAKKLLRESRFRLWVERRLERLCFENADAVVINTPEATECYGALYPDCTGKIHTITEGFDGEELARAAAALEEPVPWRDLDEDTFVISHAGVFSRYGDEDRAPYALLEALAGLLNDGVVYPGSCRVIFAGDLSRETRSWISKLGLDELIEAPGFVSRFDAVRLMLRSDLLVLFDPYGDGRTYVRSKLYEYLGSGKRILGVVPDGASRELLKRTGRGFLVYPDDVKGIRRAIVASLGSRNAPAEHLRFDPTSYDRERLTKELAALLDDLVGERSGNEKG